MSNKQVFLFAHQRLLNVNVAITFVEEQVTFSDGLHSFSLNNNADMNTWIDVFMSRAESFLAR